MSTICFYAQFTASKLGVNSLTVTWDIERITRSDGTRSALVTGGANGITVGRRGLYGYVLTGADLTTYDYVATAITATSTVDFQEVPALWTLWSISWHDIATSIMNVVGSIGKLFVDNINAAIDSRMATFTYTAPDNASITAIKAKTDNLPNDPADQSLLLAAIDSVGNGTIAYTPNRVTDPDSNPLSGVNTWVTTSATDPAIGVQARAYTNAFGLIDPPFLLDVGTYYVWRKHGSYTFTNPETAVIT